MSTSLSTPPLSVVPKVPSALYGSLSLGRPNAQWLSTLADAQCSKSLPAASL